MTPFLPDWDGAGTVNTLLPLWAHELSRTCTRYAFTTMLVHDGHAVVAARVAGTVGPMLVITSSQEEMLAALGLKPDKPSR